jgi:hypothetical protein
VLSGAPGGGQMLSDLVMARANNDENAFSFRRLDS